MGGCRRVSWFVICDVLILREQQGGGGGGWWSGRPRRGTRNRTWKAWLPALRPLPQMPLPPLGARRGAGGGFVPLRFHFPCPAAPQLLHLKKRPGGAGTHPRTLPSRTLPSRRHSAARVGESGASRTPPPGREWAPPPSQCVIRVLLSVCLEEMGPGHSPGVRPALTAFSLASSPTPFGRGGVTVLHLSRQSRVTCERCRGVGAEGKSRPREASRRPLRLRMKRQPLDVLRPSGRTQRRALQPRAGRVCRDGELHEAPSRGALPPAL